MKDTNPSSIYLKDKAKQAYFKSKAKLIGDIADFRVKLSEEFSDKGDKVQYEINELHGFRVDFKIINQIIVQIKVITKQNDIHFKSSVKHTVPASIFEEDMLKLEKQAIEMLELKQKWETKKD